MVTVRSRLDPNSIETVPFDEFVSSVRSRLETIQYELLREARLTASSAAENKCQHRQGPRGSS